MIKGLLSLTLLATVLCSCSIAAKVQKRKIANIETNLVASHIDFTCVLQGKIEDTWKPLNSKKFTKQQLQEIDGQGFRGSYFDVFRQYEFSVYIENHKLIIAPTSEDFDNSQTRSFDTLPASVSIKANILHNGVDLYTNFRVSCD